jgi:hypothetical protein
MARKKRKYIRRKQVHQAALPLSSLILGLLPMLFMAAAAGIYLLMQYSNPIDFANISLPPSEMPFRFPEVTVSFGEMGESLVKAAVYVAEWVISGLLTLLDWGETGAVRIYEFFTVGIASSIETAGSYTQALSWTVNDFFRFTDITEKRDGLISAILRPFTFLNPTPLFEAVGQKSQESTASMSDFFSPVGPVIAYIWESFKQTADQLKNSLIETFEFIASQKNVS